jgi:hypothetical protein
MRFRMPEMRLRHWSMRQVSAPRSYAHGRAATPRDRPR